MTTWIYPAILAAFTLCAVAEALWPARQAQSLAGHRMTINFAVGLGNLAIAAVLNISSTAAAIDAQARGWGLFNHVAVHPVLAFVTILLAQSLTRYTTHRLYHRLPWLWPIHALHHRDTALDLSTGFRSHPLDLLLTSLVVSVVIHLIGPPVTAAIGLDILLSVNAFWQHGNFRLPVALASKLESVFITPRVHLVHHGVERDLHDSNYGDIFSVWDRMFGTWQAPKTQEFALGLEK